MKIVFQDQFTQVKRNAPLKNQMKMYWLIHDYNSSFADYIACEMDKLDPDLQNELRNIISNSLNEKTNIQLKRK